MVSIKVTPSDIPCVWSEWRRHNEKATSQKKHGNKPTLKMDAVELMGEHIQHNPNLLAEYDDQSYALGGEKNITSSVYDCTVEDVEYIYNTLSIHIQQQKYSHILNLFYLNLMFLWPCIMNWPYKTTNVMHWKLFIRQILLLSSTCFEYQVLIFRRT